MLCAKAAFLPPGILVATTLTDVLGNVRVGSMDVTTFGSGCSGQRMCCRDPGGGKRARSTLNPVCSPAVRFNSFLDD